MLYVITITLENICEGKEENEPTKEEFSNSDIKECRDELIWGMAESIFYGSDIKAIINECNETIERYA